MRWRKNSGWRRTWPCSPSANARSVCANSPTSLFAGKHERERTQAGKRRADHLLVERGLAESRERAQALIIAGYVMANGQKVQKPGQSIPEDASLEVTERLRYVSRGGLKLEAALEHFAIDVTGKVCIDVGSSTGGFTDCLLQHGAARVYAFDVGSGQLDWKLRNDPRVVVREGVNARLSSAV